MKIPDIRITPSSNEGVKYFIIAVVLYVLFVVLYLLRERILKRKKNAAKKPAFNPFRAAPKEDIVGKSKFDLRHSLHEATSLINSEKRTENSDTFADEIKKDAPAVIPLDKLDAVFSDNDSSDKDSNEINLEIENTTPEFEPDDDLDETDDENETESGNTEGIAGVSYAQGVGFDDLAGMLHTVNNDTEASADQREEAGRVLVEIRQTDMFEQVVSGEPKKSTVVTSLMDEYFAAFHRKKQATTEADEPIAKAPKEFDVRSFA